MIIYSTYLEVFIFNKSILARALQCAHKFKKIQFSLENIIFLGFREVGSVSIFSSILIQSQWFKMIKYSKYIEGFFFNKFILRALYSARINSILKHHFLEFGIRFFMFQLEFCHKALEANFQALDFLTEFGEEFVNLTAECKCFFLFYILAWSFSFR